MTRAKPAAPLLAAAVLLALAACGDRVENTGMAQSSPPNVEIHRQGAEGAKDGKSGIGVEQDTRRMGAAPDRKVQEEDDRIATDVKASLAANPDFGALQFDVESDRGKVTLRGRAPDEAARDRAAEIARSVNGVKSVDNRVTVG
jgi:osmotically-inducible protein OsmY